MTPPTAPVTGPAASESGVVLVTSRSFSSGSVDLTSRLTSLGLAVVRAPADHDLAALQPVLATAVAWIAGTGPVTAQHLAAAPRLRVVARYGVGTDSVDLGAAAAAGIPVTNTPGANSEAVAEHAIALSFAVLRALPSGDRRVRAGDWGVTRGRQLAGSTVGVVGFGRIGRAVAARLSALGCTVLVHDPFVPDSVVRAAGHQVASLDQIRDDCSLVSLHVPGGDLLVDSAWVASCAPDQVLVNTARAGLVDETAVAEGLRTGRLRGYAADTLSTESATDGASALLADEFADTVVLTPHLGAQTVEAVDLMGTMAVDNVLAVLAGDEPMHPVTLEGALR
ncbi:NAD(P)-dependent oxidoreductase [Ornithinimicrobium cryptoxanthini]|uniref:NAD(P)-dependent oxidoreductase n=1 Tax=Ornithinimicrobium cryptoxanthini TaxID=2934161 RepID=UPI0021197AD9|nr:NAD(P)-dependent oxidoreductase [Ornithinimicrobium cryptoxanthini]